MLAIVKYTNTLVKSLTVVMNKPLANEGSNPIESINNGIKLPAMVATVIAKNIDTPMIPPKIQFACHKPTTTKIINPVAIPLIIPVATSDNIVFTKTDSSSFKPILRTATAKDCVPAFPAVPVINVMKIESTLACPIIPS